LTGFAGAAAENVDRRRAERARHGGPSRGRRGSFTTHRPGLPRPTTPSPTAIVPRDHVLVTAVEPASESLDDLRG
jgi:hypothetical protein